jgi:hypothetical protein
MAHPTKDKGDLAVIKTMVDLTEKGYDVLTAAVSEHLPFDLVGYKDGKFTRFQVKYRENGFVSNKTTWGNTKGSQTKKYLQSDFDYYAIYIPDKNVICYPAITFGGCKITTELPNSATPFYWYEDFLDLTRTANRKTYHDFGYTLTGDKSPKMKLRKVTRPSKEELEKLLFEYPMTDLAKQFGVSNKAIEKWAKAYSIKTPGLGYWSGHKKLII